MEPRDRGAEEPRDKATQAPRSTGAASVEAGCLETSVSLEEQECHARPLTHPTGTEAFKRLPGTFVSLPLNRIWLTLLNVSLTSTSQHGKSE